MARAIDERVSRMRFWSRMTASSKTLPAFDMMRYQKLSTDCPLPSNGRKPGLKACKEDISVVNNDQISIYNSPADAKHLRIKSPAASSPHASHSSNPLPADNAAATSSSVATAPRPDGSGHREVSPIRGDVLLQWGHRKRLRCSRSESRAAGDAESSGPSRNGFKPQRRCSIRSAAAAAATFADAPPSCSTTTANLAARISTKDRSGVSTRGEKRSFPSPMALAASPARNGCIAAAGDSSANSDSARQRSVDQFGCAAASAAAGGGAEKTKADQIELPRIYISLSRKEKEEDFFAMKGTKLPQRPKKRAKNIDRTLQYCFPGMWLSDLTRARYEVREKKSVKKKKRGLKRMDSMDSDSE
ncbi:hypothetical protein AXF42_Ash001159 [Apostasia shenzhenica]|uniref:DUF1639 domain-containing protein n=1 Tax=Apostasia shenzhenica TaxID=1088818 RepID=A0A2I0AU86_9ASPA|nr:hypothetical protein AXF42_Ash001159 [Apostasia shenzhenica]